MGIFNNVISKKGKVVMIKSWLNKRKRIWKRKKKKNFFTISGKKDNFKNCTKLTLKHIKSEYIENENNIKLLFRVFSNIFNNIYKKYCHKKSKSEVIYGPTVLDCSENWEIFFFE